MHRPPLAVGFDVSGSNAQNLPAMESLLKALELYYDVKRYAVSYRGVHLCETKEDLDKTKGGGI
jgi:hypothetical protein